jgi:hypothetical protein
MSHNLSRRDFLKLGALGLGSLAFRPFTNISSALKDESLPVSPSNRSVFTANHGTKAQLFINATGMIWSTFTTR